MNRSASKNNKSSGKSDIVEDMNQKKSTKCNVKVPILPPRANINQALTLQNQTNNLLKHIISQNNKQIQLLTQLLEK